jgi:nitrogenase molybdenum-cofactor synthesis protein NifE
MQIVGTSVRKSTEADKERIREILGEEARLFDQIPNKEMYRMLSAGEADIMLSGGRTQFVALKAKVPWLDINQERHHAYAGYVGMVELVKEIDKALNNPVWQHIRKPAPWAEATWEQAADAAIAREAAELTAGTARAEHPAAAPLAPAADSRPVSVAA